jgi:hypothetical protein
MRNSECAATNAGSAAARQFVEGFRHDTRRSLRAQVAQTTAIVTDMVNPRAVPQLISRLPSTLHSSTGRTCDGGGEQTVASL